MKGQNMPALSSEQIRSIFDDALTKETVRRSQGMTLQVAADPQTLREIEQVGLEAVARAQLMVAAPSTNEGAVYLRLARQARQLDHARNQAHESMPADGVVALGYAYTMTVMVAQLGLQPAELWESFASSLMESNVDLLASLVAAGHTSLPPAEVDHD